MPKESAFAKAKVKKQGGGFGASKSGRFDMPKESWEQGPSSTSYDYDHNSIGGNLKKSASKQKLARSINKGAGGGFGMSAPRFDKVNGMSNDAPGPGAYADGMSAVKSTFKTEKRSGKTSSFGSTAQHEIGAFASSISPAPTTYAPQDGIGATAKKKFREKSKAFGGAARFEGRENGMGGPEVVQADYDSHVGMGDEAKKASSNLRAKGAFGMAAPRFEKTDGQSNDAPGPGAYSEKPGAFKTPSTPSAAFASKSGQHTSTPSANAADQLPGAGEYDTASGYDATDKFAKKSFNAASTGVGSSSAGFGSSAVRAVDKKVEATPGPGSYSATHKTDVKGLNGAAMPSSVFASSSKQEADRLFPSYGDMQSLTFLPPGGMGTQVSHNKSKASTWGGTIRFEGRENGMGGPENYAHPESYEELVA